MAITAALKKSKCIGSVQKALGIGAHEPTSQTIEHDVQVGAVLKNNPPVAVTEPDPENALPFLPERYPSTINDPFTTKFTLLFVQSPKSPVTCSVTPTGIVRVALLPELVTLKSPLTVKSELIVRNVLFAIVTFRLPLYEVLPPVGHADPLTNVHVSALKLALVPFDMLDVQLAAAKEHCAEV